jgi:hypothetical protein
MQFVADSHTFDLKNYRQTDPFSACNAHSWFDGPFQCCFNDTSAANAW